MRRKLFILLLCLSAMITLNVDSNAQSRLIHYWSFNTFIGVFHNPNFYGIPADYSIIDTSKAKVLYKLMPGVSLAYLGYIDFVASVLTDYDTVNARFSAPGGNGIRVRNPSDSAYLYIYMPTTNYQNIT